MRMIPEIKEKIEPYMQEGVFGMLWNDYDKGAKIIKSIYLAPKTYAVRLLYNDGTLEWVMKCKGIPRKDIRIEHFYAAMEGESSTIDMENRLMKSGTRDGRKNGIDVEPFSIYSLDMTRTINKDPFEGRIFDPST